ncbi:MAG: glycosyltransferase family 39 protein [Elusimicrobiota bacterium]|nr:glycosyltransferase family 39 protein [Elusimicrobiota bacterium]
MKARQAAAAAAATVLAYLPALRFPLLSWDDDVNVLRNADLAFSASGLSWMFTGSRLGHWHPLTWLSLALDKALWGADPMGFHLTNLVLHAASAALLFLCARRLLDDEEGWASLLAAGLWALHPLRVESVAWVTERRDVLSGLLLLGSLYAHLRSVEEKSSKWPLLAVALGGAAMFSKVFAVVWPAVLVVVDAVLLGRGARWKEKVPYLFFAAPSLGMNLAAQAATGAAVPLAAFGLEQRLAQAVFGLAFYPLKTLLPFGLSPLYELSPLLQPAPFAWSLAAVLAAGTWWLIWGRENRPLTAALLCYGLLLAPALGLFKSGRMSAADRWSYLPAVPLSLLLAAAAAPLLRRREGRVAALAVSAVLFALTRAQLTVWSSDEALWRRAAATQPLSYYARLKLASALAAAGRLPEADSARRDALSVHRTVFETAAAVLANRGETAASEAALARAKAGPVIAP